MRSAEPESSATGALSDVSGPESRESIIATSASETPSAEDISR